MYLIISLLGQHRGDLFKEKFILDKKKNNILLLDHILSKFSFCKKIFIIVEKNKIKNKNINFKKKIRLRLFIQNLLKTKLNQF